MTSDSHYIVSGGVDGEVRKWELLPQKQKLLVSLKEHKGTINMVKIKDDDKFCISCCEDGSVIVWDIIKNIRVMAYYANTMFKCAMYYIDNTQILTCGTDRKITYYDVVDNSAIRILSIKGNDKELTALDITRNGKYFVSGGGDSIIRLWNYDEGYINYEGVGHSDCINKIVISPAQNYIVSVGSDSGVFIWDLPN